MPAQKLSSKVDGDEIVRKVGTPIVIATVYGIYGSVMHGVAPENYLDALIPAVGGAVALVVLFVYVNTAVFPRGGPGWGQAFGNLIGFGVYFYSLYVFFVMGCYRLYGAVFGSFSFWGLVAGIFWILIGYRILKQFYIVTELVRER